MPTMNFPYDGSQNLFDMCIAIEAVSSVRIISASVEGGIATVYYITGSFDDIVQTRAVDDFPWHDYPDFRDDGPDYENYSYRCQTSGE